MFTNTIPGIGCLTFVLATHVFAQQTQPIQIQVLTQTTKSWDGSALPNYPRSKPEITIKRFKIEPGAMLPCHKHPFINAGVVLQGELKIVTQDQKTLHIKAGDPLVETVNEWHYGVNEGTEVAEVIIVYAGKPGKPVSVSGNVDQCTFTTGTSSK